MKVATTVTIDVEVLIRAKREAEKRGKSLSALVEEALRGYLGMPEREGGEERG